MRLIALLLAAMTVPSTAVSPERVEGPARDISIASFNVMADRPGHEDTLRAAAELDTDVLLLQEVSRPWSTLLQEHLSERYPHAVFENLEQPFGAIGVLSKLPIRSHVRLNTKHGAFPALLVEIEVDGRPLDILNVHLFPPVRLAPSMGWMEGYSRSQEIHRDEIVEHWARLGRKPAVIVGDFNEDELGLGIQWLAERGYETALRRRTVTWRWKTRLGEVRWPLDHVLHDSSVRVRSARVVEDGASDHLPVVVELSVPTAER